MKATTCSVHQDRFIAAVKATGILAFFTLALLATVSSAAAVVITRPSSVFPGFASAAGSQSVVDYWTQERMKLARPPGLPGTGVGASLTGSATMTSMEDNPEHQTDILSALEVALYPHTSIGKVFFTLNGFDHVCSACAITSEGRWGEGTGQLVLTAGHCLNNGFGSFASNFMFAPGYSDGNSPFGLWTAERLFTTNEWHSGFGAAMSRDVGFALVRGTGEYAGEYLHDVVDALGIAFTESYPEDGLDLHVEPTTGTERASFGYGVLNWGGESQVRSVAQVDTIDTNFWPPPLGLPSSHTGGSSGGPWLYNYAPDSFDWEQNVVTGINGYAYAGTDRIYSPQFDDLIHRLWSFSASWGIPQSPNVPEQANVPEPSSLTLLGLGCVALTARRRRLERAEPFRRE